MTNTPQEATQSTELSFEEYMEKTHGYGKRKAEPVKPVAHITFEHAPHQGVTIMTHGILEIQTTLPPQQPHSIMLLHTTGTVQILGETLDMLAKHINYPLNYHVTINFSLTNIDPKEAAKCFAKMRGERFNKWASRPRKNAGKAFPPTFVFAFENNKDGTAYMTLEQNNPHNVHVHWSLHIPPARFYDFENMGLYSP